MRMVIGRLIMACATAVLFFSAGAAQAQWELDTTKSSMSFVSIKNDSVGEIHSFASMAGNIDAGGEVQVTINLDSVETLIPIRNERMREMLFDTVKFPAATITATVDPALIAAASEGSAQAIDLPLTLSLHGTKKTMTVPVMVLGESGGRIHVFTPAPAIVNAADFGLEPGVTLLQSVAGLKAISVAVPVTVHLVFTGGG